ncbi:TniQ protein [Variovorax sp. HW608]|uniref:TnsD family Tn7-like transposition protein n=1 Tax=Variovorax sp. HW608 TaxID=1034889 RepID=UPI00081FDE8F|nr:TnsD family Tn7-like transposition protein [Variovorax sp. HW608]SCK42651.1 TniQ protein [Variovorax sp. HW608]
MAPRGPLPFTPLHQKDETLYSHLGRVNAHNCCAGSSRRFLHEVFGDMKAVSSADLPSRLDSMLDRWPEVSPYPTVDEVIEKTTQYPYHRSFMPAERWKELVRRASCGPGSSLKTWLGLVAHRFSASAMFRSCIECDRLSWDINGVLYWHRSHMLPGVVVCPIHRMPLIEHFMQSKDSERSALRLPPLAGTLAIVTRSSLSSLTRFSVTSGDALWSEDRSLTGDLCVATYRARLRELGLCSTSGRVRWAELSSLILESNDGFRGWSVGERISQRTGSVLGWLYGLLRDRERLCHPLTHIVLINLLFDSFAAYAAAAKEAQGPDLSNISPRTEEILDPVPPVDVANCDVSCRVAAIELGISVTTVVKRRRALGLPISERRKTLTPDRLAIVRKRLATGVPPAQVAQEAHVSLSSVYRIRSETAGLASHPMKVSDEEVVAYRKRWVSTGLRASSFRQRRVLDGAAYAWLYRHDRDWLTANRGRAALPVGRKLRQARIDWDKRDENYARRIAALSDDQRGRSPRKRVSASALLRGTGAQTSIRAHLYRLPKTREALRTCSESVGSFQKQRYAQAAASLVGSDGFFAQWKALKLAGLRQAPADGEVERERKG